MKSRTTSRAEEGGKRRPVPAYTPHALRHTAASRLVQDGVPIYDVQAFLGHESVSTTQRYAHLRPDAHDTVEASWARLVTHVRRTGRAGDGAKGP